METILAIIRCNVLISDVTPLGSMTNGHERGESLRWSLVYQDTRYIHYTRYNSSGDASLKLDCILSSFNVGYQWSVNVTPPKEIVQLNTCGWEVSVWCWTPWRLVTHPWLTPPCVMPAPADIVFTIMCHASGCFHPNMQPSFFISLLSHVVTSASQRHSLVIVEKRCFEDHYHFSVCTVKTVSPPLH